MATRGLLPPNQAAVPALRGRPHRWARVVDASAVVIEPRARVGIQARLGIDAVLAPCHPADPLTLGVAPGPDAQLDPKPVPPLVGAAHLNRNNPLL